MRHTRQPDDHYERSAASAALQDRPRLAHVDGLRALAALYVLVHHAYLTVWPPEYHRSPANDVLLVTGWLGFGRMAVSMFIVLSGFCLMLPVVSRHDSPFRPAQFLWRRFRRIVPTYLAALALSLALALTVISRATGTHWDVSVPVTPDGLVLHVLLLQDLYASNQINHAFWSIALEWHIYFLFPVLVMLWQWCGPWVTTLGSAALLYTIWARIGIPNDLPIIFLPQFVLLFNLGMLAATVVSSQHRTVLHTPAGMRWFAVAGVACLATCAYIALRGEDSFYPDLLGALTVCGLLIACSFSPSSPLSRMFGWRPLVAIGMFSYSLYLIHAPLLQVIWQYAIAPLHLTPARAFALLVSIGVLCILGAAYLFFFAFERPFMARRRVPKSAASEKETRIQVATGTP